MYFNKSLSLMWGFPQILWKKKNSKNKLQIKIGEQIFSFQKYKVIYLSHQTSDEKLN